MKIFNSPTRIVLFLFWLHHQTHTNQYQCSISFNNPPHKHYILSSKFELPVWDCYNQLFFERNYLHIDICSLVNIVWSSPSNLRSISFQSRSQKVLCYPLNRILWNILMDIKYISWYFRFSLTLLNRLGNFWETRF